MYSSFFFRCATIINWLFPLCGGLHSREIQTKPIERCLSSNKTMYFIQRFFEILNLFTGCLGQDCQSRVDFSEWFKSELKEESLFQAHKPCWKLY